MDKLGWFISDLMENMVCPIGDKDGKHRTTKLCCRTSKNGPLIEDMKDTVIYRLQALTQK